MRHEPRRSFDCPSHAVIQQAMPPRPVVAGEKADPNRPRNIKLCRVGQENILLTRGERKRVLRKLMALKVRRGELSV